MSNENNRETGAREPKVLHSQDKAHADVSQDAATNKKPKGIGLSAPMDDTNDKLRHSDGTATGSVAKK